MNRRDGTYENILQGLRRRGVLMQAGLTDAELEQVERATGLEFPPDLRTWVQLAVPIAPGFPRWRDFSPKATLRSRVFLGGAAALSLSEQLSHPERSLLADVEAGAWSDVLGPRPEREDAALTLVREALGSAPQLLPVFRHRYLVAEPPTAGNPVISVFGLDVAWAGDDLESYLVSEFSNRHIEFSEAQEVPLWSQLARDASGLSRSV